MSITDATDDTKNESTVCGTTTNMDHQSTSITQSRSSDRLRKKKEAKAELESKPAAVVKVLPNVEEVSHNHLSSLDGVGGLGFGLGLPSELQPTTAALNIGEYNLQDIINEVNKDWNTGNDAKLRYAVTHTPKTDGSPPWQAIQKSYFPGYSKQFIQSRWYNINMPSTKERGSDVWSTVDDVKLLLAKENYSGDCNKMFDTIAKGFPGRTAIDCKKRFYNVERTLKNVRAGTYSVKTDQVYVAAAYLRLTKPEEPVPSPQGQKPSAAKTDKKKNTLELGAASGCQKCIEELNTGEKVKSTHSDQCPKKRGPSWNAKTKKKAGSAPKTKKKAGSAPKSKKQKMSSAPEMLPPSMLDPFGSVGDAPQPLVAPPPLDDQQSTNDGKEKESDIVEVEV